tara:strand:+ start:1462 stop:1929 length:468 start_codon:yes stop_codon:yes gene_type:complete
MELRGIKEKINAFYNIDIAERSRKRNYSNARKLYCYMANKHNHSYTKTGALVGIGHDAVIYHSNLAKKWIEQGDKAFIKQVEDVFNYRLGKSSEERKLDRIHKAYDPLLLEVPIGLHREVLAKIKLMVMVHEMKESENKTKVYIADDMDMANPSF